MVKFDVARGRRLLERYLGPAPETWDARFRDYLLSAPGSAPRSVWARVMPSQLVARDLSFCPSRALKLDIPVETFTGRRTRSDGCSVATDDTRIRQARPDDIGRLVPLLGLLFSQEAEFVADPVRQQDGLAELLAHPDRSSVLVAEREGEVLGMVSLQVTVSTALGGRVGLVEDLIVQTAERGRGIGTALLVAVMLQAEGLGCRRVTLLTDGTNAAAQRFYEGHGFVASPMIPMRRLVDDLVSRQQ